MALPGVTCKALVAHVEQASRGNLVQALYDFDVVLGHSVRDPAQPGGKACRRSFGDACSAQVVGLPVLLSLLSRFANVLDT